MTQIFKDYSEFINREDKKVNGVSKAFTQLHDDWEEMNDENEGCWNCSDCSDCSGCSRCSDCSGCSRLENAAPVSNTGFDIPVIENIHQKVFEAVSKPNALMMDTWHTCETTHCRAGWVVHLAGAKGYELELKTSPVFAAMQIYNKSSEIKVSPPRFFEDNKIIALKDIKECAEKEAATV